MKKTLTMLIVICLVTLIAGHAMAVTVTMNATNRDSVYAPTWTGWYGDWLYMGSVHDHYIQFDMSAMANNPYLVIDSASLTVQNGSYVNKWSGEWDQTATVYRATSLNFISQPSYDSTVAYGSDGVHQTSPSVFDVTQLVTGWVQGAWSGDVVGGMALRCPTGDYNYFGGDLSAATLAISYHYTSTPTITIYARNRDSVYTPSWTGWTGYWAYLKNTHDHYLWFNIGSLANNSNIVISSASLTLQNGSHVQCWGGGWDQTATVYRATSLDFVNPPFYDSSVAYGSDGVHQTTPSVFDVTNLVNGWAQGSWSSSDIVGGMVLRCPAGNYNYFAGDLSAAALTISFSNTTSGVTQSNATNRDSVYTPIFYGWTGYWAYLKDTHDHYIKWDVSALTNDHSIAIDAATITLQNGSHVNIWSGVWDLPATVYRANSLDFFNQPSYASSVAYGSDGIHQTAPSVFDVTNLVRGWAQGAWGSDVTGGIALKCPQGNYNYFAGDTAAATLTVNHHTAEVSYNQCYGKAVVSSSYYAGDCPPAYATDGILSNVLIFGNDDTDQRLSVNGFNSALREVRLWTYPGDPGRVPSYVTLRSSIFNRSSLNAGEYETYLGRYYLTPDAFSHTYKELYHTDSEVYSGFKAALLDVNAPVGTRSLLADFGPGAAFNGMGIRVAEIEVFASHTTSAQMLEPLHNLSTSPPANTAVQVQISGMDWSSDIGTLLYSEFKDSAPNLVLLGAERYDKRTWYDFQPGYEGYLYYCSGSPLFNHPWLLPTGARPYVKMSDGTDVNDHLGDYGAYELVHLTAFQDTNLRNAWQTLMPLIQVNNNKGVIVADHHYPIGSPAYQPCGYGTTEINAFRADLAASDAGIQVYNADGSTSTWKFWDYFNFYNGFTWTASNVGLSSWSVFSPYTGDWNPTTYQVARQIYLFYALLRYETLKFDSFLGQSCAQNGMKYFPIYVGEGAWHGLDKLVGLRTVGIHQWGYEAFTQPTNMYEDTQDHTWDIPYSYWGRLRRNNPASANEIALVLETAHFGSSEHPYWSSKFTFANTLDLFLAGTIKSMDIDFFPPNVSTSDDGYILKNAGVHSTLRAASFQDVANPFHTPTRSILVIGERGSERKDYPFTPLGLGSAGTDSIGAVPWLLSRLGYEFDFSDKTLEGVTLSQYSVIFYDCRDLRDGIFTQLQTWLNGASNPKRRLITYGVLPTRRINNTNWKDSPDPGLVKHGGLTLIDSASGSPLSLSSITAGGTFSGTVTLVNAQGYDWSGVNLSLLSLPSRSTMPTYVSSGTTRILKYGTRALLSNVVLSSNNETVYFNYDFGRLGDFTFDSTLLNVILNAAGIQRVYSSQPALWTSVHSYINDGTPNMRLVILRDRDGIQTEVTNYTGTDGTMTFRLGPEPGRNTSVNLNRWVSGDLSVYSFNTNQVVTVPASSTTVPLSLTGQMSDVFVILPTGSDTTWLTKLQSLRQQLTNYVGDDMDSMLISAWGH